MAEATDSQHPSWRTGSPLACLLIDRGGIDGTGAPDELGWRFYQYSYPVGPQDSPSGLCVLRQGARAYLLLTYGAVGWNGNYPYTSIRDHNTWLLTANESPCMTS